MALHSADEQYMLELVNRARLDPAAEAARYGVALGGLPTGSRQPLAGDTDLARAAELHSAWMLEVDTFSHTGRGGSSAGQRMADAGYDFTGAWTWGENIAYSSASGDLTDEIATQHGLLFRSAGHRGNILQPAFDEIGVGTVTGLFGSFPVAMTTQNFAGVSQNAFLTGVVYADRDGNRFYTPGEGRGGIDVDLRAIGGAAGPDTATVAAGGYEVRAPAGTWEVTFSGSGLPAPVGVTIAIASANVKLDLVGNDAVASSASLTLGAGIKSASLLGTAGLQANGNSLANTLTGNVGGNALFGFGGPDTIEGGAGADTVVGNGGNDALAGGTGADRMIGHSGADRFVFRAMNEAGDTIVGFRPVAEGDRLDLRALFDLFGWSGSGQPGAEWVRAVQAGGTLRVEVDPDGDGVGYTPLATLEAATPADLGAEWILA